MTLSSILGIGAIILVVVIIVLALVYFSMSTKEKKENTAKKKNTNEEVISSQKIAKSYTMDSIFNFMEFDKIEDNMIVQKGGKKFLMVIECQGINYDLMSEIEKTSVESGFIQFLNTLRNPIQIYVQTRTINLENSIKNYKEKLAQVKSDLALKENRYKSMLESGRYPAEQVRNQALEVKRQTNLYEYGRDIIYNTERMSMNKNVLRKKYYLILSYYFNNVEGEDLNDSEIAEMAFSDLYTKCQSTIRALGISGVNGRVLDSYALVDLLYNAYNRDESENYGIERAEKAGFDNLYITSPDVLEKRMKALNAEIGTKGVQLAENSIKFANEKLKKELEEKEGDIDNLIAELAGALIDENEQYLSKDLANEAKKEVKKRTADKKRGVKNG